MSRNDGKGDKKTTKVRRFSWSEISSERFSFSEDVLLYWETGAYEMIANRFQFSFFLHLLSKHLALG